MRTVVPVILVILGVIGCGPIPRSANDPNPSQPVVRWRTDFNSDQTKHLTPDVARVILIARAYYDNEDPIGRGMGPYTFSVFRRSGGRWTVAIESSSPKPETLIIDSDGAVIGGFSS